MIGKSDKEIVGEYKFNKLFNVPNSKETISEYERIKSLSKFYNDIHTTQLPLIQKMSCGELVDDLCCFICLSLDANQLRKTSFESIASISPIHDVASSKYETTRASYVHDIFLKKCKNYNKKINIDN
jgi:hypothetical protein